MLFTLFTNHTHWSFIKKDYSFVVVELCTPAEHTQKFIISKEMPNEDVSRIIIIPVDVHSLEMLLYLLDLESHYFVLQGQINNYTFFNMFVKQLKNTNFA